MIPSGASQLVNIAVTPHDVLAHAKSVVHMPATHSTGVDQVRAQLWVITQCLNSLLHNRGDQSRAAYVRRKQTGTALYMVGQTGGFAKAHVALRALPGARHSIG